MKTAIKVLTLSPLYWRMTYPQRLLLVKWFVKEYGELGELKWNS